MNREDVRARLATIADLPFVSQDGHIPQTVVTRKIAQKECFIVAENDRPVGYLRLEFLWSQLPYIALINIKKEYQKRGYSRVLLDFVTEYLRVQGYDTLYSSSQVYEPEPQAWHRHLGFKECGVINGINEGGVGEIFFRISF